MFIITIAIYFALIVLGTLDNNYIFCMKNQITLNSDFDNHYNKALIHECSQQHPSLEIIKNLIEKKAHVNTTNIESPIPLELICTKNPSLEIIKLLIDSKADVNENKSKPLFILCDHEDPSLDIIEFIIESKAEVNKERSCGVTLLTQACFKQKPSLTLIKLLIDKKADINAAPSFGNTILWDICFQKNLKLEVIEFLIKCKADINMKTGTRRYNNTLLHILCSDKAYPLYEKNPHIPMLTLLLNNKADTNATNLLGYTPLHILLSRDKKPSLNAFKLLIDNNADINAKSHNGNTLLHKICIKKKPSLKIFKFLLYSYFPELKHIIFTYLVCLKIKNFKIPKFVNFEILKFFIIHIIVPIIENLIRVENNNKKTPLMIIQEMKHNNIISFLEEPDKLWSALIEFWKEDN